jgi:outer membrane immunogenic protein
MKKIVLVSIVTVFTSLMLQAQCPLEVGGKQLNAGVGFSGWGVPLYVGLDYGLVEDITLGGKLSLTTHQGNDLIIGLAANGNYHFNTLLDIPKEWDFYAGLTCGYFANSDFGLGLYAQIGGRYFFKNNFGLNLELGGGNISGGTFGITYKF